MLVGLGRTGGRKHGPAASVPGWSHGRLHATGARIESIRQNLSVGTFADTLVQTVLAGGLRIVERIVPGPERLGAPLPTPAPAGADPVVLVSGFANNPSGWDAWVRSLVADGFQVFVFHVPRNGLGDMHAASRALAAYIGQVRFASGRDQVDLVGFSEGGLLARMAVAEDGARAGVDEIVTMATPHNGLEYASLIDHLDWLPVLGAGVPIAARQMVRGSALLRQLDAADVALRAHGPVRYASVHQAGFDGFVSSAAASLAGAVNVVVRDRSLLAIFGLGGPDHYSMYRRSDAAYTAVRAVLLVAHGQPLPGGNLVPH